MANRLLKRLGHLGQMGGRTAAVLACMYFVFMVGLYSWTQDEPASVFRYRPSTTGIANGAQGGPSTGSDPLERPADDGKYWLLKPDESFDGTAAAQALLNGSNADGWFEWHDWIDLHQAFDFGKAADDESNNGTDSSPMSNLQQSLSEMQFPLRTKVTENEQAMIGKVYLEYLMPAPRRAVFLREGKNIPLKHRDSKRNHRDYGQSEEDAADGAALNMTPPLLSQLDPAVPLEERITVDLPREVFVWDLERMKRIGDSPDASLADKKHADMIKLAAKNVDRSGKHFNEVNVKNDAALLGAHYDWRFFNGFRKGNDHEASMHHLIRAWAQFCIQEGLASWIAHGSLLGWYWNGISMPWDTDNDVQMPIMELDRFARNYNGTLVIEDAAEGTGRYYIDVAPWYVQRTRGNGNNVIDARFIDIRSGIYIDITGLAITGTEINRVNCKNHHFYPISRLSPMRQSLYEGANTYVPNNYDATLKQEYKKYSSKDFDRWSFRQPARLWVPKKACRKFKDTNQYLDEKGALTFYGACENDDIWHEFSAVSEVTAAHTQELELYSYTGVAVVSTEDGDKPREQIEKEVARKLAAILGRYYPPFRYDPSPYKR